MLRQAKVITNDNFIGYIAEIGPGIFDSIRTGIGNRAQALVLWLQRCENHSALEPPVQRKPEASGSVSMASSSFRWSAATGYGLALAQDRSEEFRRTPIPARRAESRAGPERERAIIDTL